MVLTLGSTAAATLSVLLLNLSVKFSVVDFMELG